MKSKSGIFRFKKFDVSHTRSSMKVGVDAVILGARCHTDGKKILEVGTGCGVISLMLAQRNSSAQIMAIDIDENSVNEANENFTNSIFSDRLIASLINFNDITLKFDAIISNPPYFESGVSDLFSSRLRARHTCDLSPEILILNAQDLLNPGGTLSFICPAEFERKLLDLAKNNDLKLLRILRITGRRGDNPKRIIPEFIFDPSVTGADAIPLVIDELTIEVSPGLFTREYYDLTKDFYYKTLPHSV